MAARGRGARQTPSKVVELLKKAVAEQSQIAVARSSGVGLYSIQRFLQGIGEPTQETLEKLAAYFGVSVPYLRGETPYFVDGAELKEIKFERGDAIIATSKGEVRVDAGFVYQTGLDLILPCLENETDEEISSRLVQSAKSIKQKLEAGMAK